MISVNGNEVEISLFPNGELKLAPIKFSREDTQIVVVTMKYENCQDLNTLMFVKSYLDDVYPELPTVLEMLYIPYERMDRQTDNQMFTAKYFGKFINSLNFDKVLVLDPHSEVIMAVLDKTVRYNLKQMVDDIIERYEIDYLFFPDNGAKKKYREVLAPLSKPSFFGDKHRDLDTGKITDYNIFENPNIKDKNILIVDDLCVKGFTTLFAAKKLKELGAAKVYFYCSHCEPAIFKGELLTTDYVDRIFTTDSLISDDHKKIERVS